MDVLEGTLFCSPNCPPGSLVTAAPSLLPGVSKFSVVVFWLVLSWPWPRQPAASPDCSHVAGPFAAWFYTVSFKVQPSVHFPGLSDPIIL